MEVVLQTTIVIIFSSMVIAIFCDSLAWGRLSSRAFIRAKGPPAIITDSYTQDQIYNLRKNQGKISEITRTLALTIISFASLLLFGEIDIVSAFHHNFFVKVVSVIGLLYGLIYHFFIGPRQLAKESHESIKLYSKPGFREFFVPYLAKLVSFFTVIFGILSVLIINIIIGIQNDFDQLFTLTDELDRLLKTPEISAFNFQLISIKLVWVGDWISQSSQKYMVISLLLLFFILFVQSTFLGNVVFKSSVDKYKFVFWIIALLSLTFSAIYLPMQYSHFYNQTQVSLLRYVDTFQIKFNSPSNELPNLLSLEDFLFDHDVNWLILKIFSGYGNMAAAITILGGFVIKKVFLSDVKATVILSLLLPSGLFESLNKFISQIGLEDLKRNRTK